MQRKALSCLLTFALLLSVSLTGFSGVSFAEADVEFTVSSGDLVVSPETPGETTIAVNLDKNPGMQALTVYLQYDPTYLKIVDCQNGSAWTDASQYFTENADNLQVDYLYFTDTECSNTGNLFNVTYQATEAGIAAGNASYDLTLEVETCENKRGDSLSSSVTNGAIEVTNINSVLTEAAEALQNADISNYTVEQAEATSSGIISAVEQAAADVLSSDESFAKVSVNKVNLTEKVDAVAGDADYPLGSDGSFKFTASLVYEGFSDNPVDTENISGVIKATPYTGKTNQELVDEAKATLETTKFTVQQSAANSADELPAALIDDLNVAVDSTGIIISSDDIQITACTPASAGTLDNMQGTNGSFAADIHLTLGKTGSGDASIAQENGIIQATPYDTVLAEAITWLDSSGNTFDYTQAEAESLLSSGSFEQDLAAKVNAGMTAAGIQVDPIAVSDVSRTALSPASSGTADQPSGTNGSFSFKVTFKHSGNAVTSPDKAGVITATPYSGTTYEQALDAAEAALEAAELKVTVDPADYKVQEVIDNKILESIQAVCQEVPEVIAVGDLDGYAGRITENKDPIYVYEVVLSKGTHEKTITLDFCIVNYLDTIQVMKDSTEDQKIAACQAYAEKLIADNTKFDGYSYQSAVLNPDTNYYVTAIAKAEANFTFNLNVEEVYGLNIKVTDSKDNPLANVGVTGVGSDGTTDSTGQYSQLGITGGDYTVTLTLPDSGYSLTKGLTVKADQNTEATFVVPYTTVEVEDANGNPLAGTAITISNDKFSDTQTTTSDGSVSWFGIAGGIYKVHLQTSGGTVLDDQITVAKDTDTLGSYTIQEGISSVIETQNSDVVVSDLGKTREHLITPEDQAVLDSGGTLKINYALQGYDNPASQLSGQDKADYQTILSSGLVNNPVSTWTVLIDKIVTPASSGQSESTPIGDTVSLVKSQMPCLIGHPNLYRVHFDGTNCYLDVITLNGTNNARYLITDGAADTSKNLGLNSGEKLELNEGMLTAYTRYNCVYMLGETSPYAISTVSDKCSISVNAEAYAGDKVEFTVNPNSGYKLSKGYPTVAYTGGTVNITNEGNNKYSFTMPDGEVTITAKCSSGGGGGGGGGSSSNASDQYKLTITASTGGTVTASATAPFAVKFSSGNKKVTTGSEITLTPKAKKGYVFDSIKAFNTSNNNIEVELTKLANGTYIFNMPSSDTTITYVFVESSSSYTATIAQAEGGTLTGSFASGSDFTDKAAVPGGVTVTLTPKADSGYALKSVKVTAASGTDVKVTKKDDSYVFTMPSSNVSIAPSFTKSEASTAESGDKAGGKQEEHQAYLFGFNDGNFYPQANMTRAQVAAMFYNLLPKKEASTDIRFNDVADDAWYAQAVNAMAALGAINGYTDGSFRPNNPVTRAELVTIAMNLFDQQVADAACSFIDVPAGYWAYDNIAKAVALGYLAGYEDQSFKPDNYIIRAEVAALVNGVLGRTPDSGIGYTSTFPDVNDPGYWAYYEILEATQTHASSAHSN